MKLPEELKNNRIVEILTAMVFGGTAVFGVMFYFYSEKLEVTEKSFNLQVETLESKLASIERGLPGFKRIDIRKLLLNKRDTILANSKQEYFSKDKFYSIKSDEYWEYKKTTQIGLLDMIYGKKSNIEIRRKMEAMGHKFPLHLWKGKEVIKMGEKGEVVNLFPYIALEKISLEDVGKLIGTNIKKQVSEEYSSEYDSLDPKISSKVDEYIAAINKSLYNDTVGTFFLAQNYQLFISALGDNNIDFKIHKIQRLGPVLYSQMTRDYIGVKANGKKPNIYNVVEILMISAKDKLYVIKIMLPSFEPNQRKKVYANVNNWLTNIKIVAE